MGKPDDLSNAIEDALHSTTRLSPEERRRQLIEAYRDHGSGNVQVTRTMCINVLRDTAKPVQVKLVAIRILDLLMDLEDHALATECVPELTFLFDIAKRKKEKDKSKRRHPKVFSKKVSADEVTKVIVAVTELLDKWGRYYEQASPGDRVEQFAAVRQDLISAGVQLPSPEDYSCVAELHVAPEAFDAPQPRTGSLLPASSLRPASGLGTAVAGRSDLDEEELKKVFEEVKRAHGVDADTANEARVRLDSMLAKWQHAAQEAVEREDYVEFERVSTVAFRYGDALSKLLEGPASVEATEPEPTVDSAPAMPKDSSISKKSRRRKKSPSPTGDDADVPVAVAETASSPWADASMPAAEPEVAPSPWSAAVEPGSSGGAWPEYAAPAADAGFHGFGDQQADAPTDGSYGGGFGPWDGNAPMGAGFGAAESAMPSGGGFGAAQTAMRPGGCAGYGADYEDPARVAELEMQVATLQQQLNSSSGGREQMQEQQLQSVQHRIRQLEPVELRFMDLSNQVGMKSEVNTQLQRELDHCRRDLHSTRQQTVQVEMRIADREELLADVQRRLQMEEQRIGYMEDEIRNHGAVHESLLGRILDADSKNDAVQHELFYIQKAFQDAHLKELSLPQSNVPYGPRSDAVLEEVGLGAQLRPPVSELSVHESDELATPSPAALRSSVAGDAISGLGAARSGGTASMQQPPEMLLYSSGPDVWASTQKMAGSPGALVFRMPPSRRDFTEKTHSNYRSLLVQQQGPLYEDPKLTMQMAILTNTEGRCAKLDFEIAIVNRGSYPIQEVSLVSKEPEYVHACELLLEPQPDPAGGSTGSRSTLWPHAQLRFRGRLTARAPFQTGPQVELSYLLPDSMHCKARVRLPFAVNRLMAPVHLDARRFLELWHSDAFKRDEVALVCPLSAALRDVRTRVASAKCMELGGTMRVLHGLGDSSTNVAMTSSYPQRNGAPPEVLVQAELGGPGGWGSACRLAIRSSSGALNRALAQVLLDILCDAPDPAVAAGPTAAPAS